MIYSAWNIAVSPGNDISNGTMKKEEDRKPGDHTAYWMVRISKH